jgi:hypothetical protein
MMKKYKEVWPSLTEYNDNIHWLESMLLTVWTDDIDANTMFRVTLDFNKTIFEFYTISDESFKNFSHFLQLIFISQF